MLPRLCYVLIALLLLTLAGGCERNKPAGPIHLSGPTMGTTWSVTLLPDPAGTEAAALQQRLQERLDQINGLMSTYDPRSEISRFNDHASTDWFAISAETAHVIGLALDISRVTNGAFDISVGPLVELWGFGPIQRGERTPSEEAIEKARARTGFQHLRLRDEPPAVSKQIADLRIDLSAIAKGYAADALSDLLEQQGFSDFLVEIGGELQIAGQRGDGTPWRIAIEKPLEDRREAGTIFQLTDTALATSGNYRNFYIEDGQRYAHTLDPLSGKPARNKLASVTVLDGTCARADALATALMVMGDEKARRFCQKHQIAAYFYIHAKTSLAIYSSPAFQVLAKEVKQ